MEIKPLFATTNKAASPYPIFKQAVNSLIDENPETTKRVVKTGEKKGTTLLAEAIAIAKMGFYRGVIAGGTFVEGFVSGGHGTTPKVITPGEPTADDFIIIGGKNRLFPIVKNPPMWEADP